MKFIDLTKKLKKAAVLTLVATVLVTSAVGCAPKEKAAAESAEKVDNYTVKLGYYNCDHMVAACVGEGAGIYKELGLNVELTGNGKVPEAMAAGQMDVGYIGATGLSEASTKGAPIMIAATNHLGGSMYLVVANDIKKPEDLLGQPVGFSSDLSTDEAWLLAYGPQTGLPADSSKFKCLEFGSQADKYLALKTGQIKAFTCCDPWASMAEFEGTGKIMGTYLEMDGQLGVCCTYAMNKKFKEEHPELAKKMVLAHTKSMEYIYTHPLESAKIFAEYYKVPVEVAEMTIYKKTVGEGRTLSWKMDEQAHKHALEVYKKFNIMENVPNYDDIAMKDILKESGADDFDQFIKEKVDPVFPVGMSFEDWKAKALEIDPQ